MYDQFGQQRIEGRARRITSARRRIDTDTRTRGRLKARDTAVGRTQRAVLAHYLGIDAQLHCIAARRGRCRAQTQLGQGRTGRHLQLQGYQIEPQHFFSNGVFDLQTGIGFNEKPFTIIGIEQEFKGAQTTIVGVTRHAERGIKQSRADRSGQMGCWRDLDQFLMPALSRTITLPQMRHRALSITQHLHFDVSCVGDVTLGIDTAIAKSR